MVRKPIMPVRGMRGELTPLPPFASHLPFSPPWLSQIKLSKSVEKVRGYCRLRVVRLHHPLRVNPPGALAPRESLGFLLDRVGAAGDHPGVAAAAVPARAEGWPCRAAPTQVCGDEPVLL